LIDTGCDQRLPDLRGAHLVVKSFAGAAGQAETLSHGTYSVTLLLGQARHKIRGMIPDARLLVANVVGREASARAQAVTGALDWMLSGGAQIVAMPLGSVDADDAIARRIDCGSEAGVLFFAAAGNRHPNAVLFPASHVSTLAVGAAGPAGNLLPECCRHPQLDLVAPGWRVPAVVRGQVVRRRSGTSVACVVAAGVGALAMSAGALPEGSACPARALAVLCAPAVRSE
jgi:subtilisin family serine protease